LTSATSRCDRLTPHRRSVLEKVVAGGGTTAARAAAVLAAAGVGVPIHSDQPLPETEIRVGSPPPVAGAALVRSLPCAELGSCPPGRRCSDGVRLCGLGHREPDDKDGVRHGGLCQRCPDWTPKSA
jgi:hypothetical protein